MPISPNPSHNPPPSPPPYPSRDSSITAIPSSPTHTHTHLSTGEKSTMDHAEKNLTDGQGHAEPTSTDASVVVDPAKDRTVQGRMTSEDEELLQFEIDPAEQKKLIKKLDMLIAPLVMVLYLIAFLDRSNIGNAYTAGLGTDLKNFPVNGLSTATSLFYVTYVTLETPMATLLKTLRPSRLIPGVTIAWGATVLGSGFLRTYGQLLATRLILGACEAALSPCMFLWLTVWYKRNEIATRQCYLFISAAISGVVGGLIAAGLLKMDGLHGLRGWQWLYIIEGSITIAIGIIVLFIMPDDYQSAWILNDREKFLMRVRDIQSREYMGDMSWSWVEVKKALTEPVVWLSGFSQLGFDVCLYGFSTFLVVIIQQFGFGTIESQLLTAPVYFLAAVVYFTGARFSDHRGVRYWLLMPLGGVTCVGYAILTGYHGSVGPMLFACFLCGIGIYICVGLHITMLSLNMAGYRKRSTAIGINQTIGNIGGVIAGQIYRTSDKPYYRLGHGVSLGCFAFGLLCMTLEWRFYVSRNKAKERMTAEDKAMMDEAGVTGDRHYSFKYEW